jgi:hypothetical protein
MLLTRTGALLIAYSARPQIANSLIALTRPVPARGISASPIFSATTRTTVSKIMSTPKTNDETPSEAAAAPAPLFWNKQVDVFHNYDDIPITQSAKIVSISRPNEADNDLLHKGPLPAGCELVQIVSSVEDIDIEKLENVNAIFCSHMKNAREPLAYLVERLPNLQWIHCRQTGIDFLQSEALSKWGQENGSSSKRTIMTNAKGQFSSTLAEYAMGAMTYFAKDFPRLQRCKANKTWDKYVATVLTVVVSRCYLRLV